MGLVNIVEAQNSGLQQSAVIITTSENMFLVVKELIRQVKCHLIAHTSSIEVALQYISSGKATLLIIDDGNEKPACSAVREIVSHPIGQLTPLLVLLMDRNIKEAEPLGHLAKIKVAPKPMTSSSFPPVFRTLLRIWATDEMIEVQKAAARVRKSDVAGSCEIFESLKKSVDLTPMITRAHALTLQKAGQITNAEKVLLDQIKAFPNNIGLLTTLGQLYMTAAMPSLADRIFKKLNEKFLGTVTYVPDLVQSGLLLNDYDQVVEQLRFLIKNEYMPASTNKFLSRVLYAAGRKKESSYVLAGSDGEFKKLESHWMETLTTQLEKAG
jgi:hypothetical protein